MIVVVMMMVVFVIVAGHGIKVKPGTAVCRGRQPPAIRMDAVRRLPARPRWGRRHPLPGADQSA